MCELRGQILPSGTEPLQRIDGSGRTCPTPRRRSSVQFLESMRKYVRQVPDSCNQVGCWVKPWKPTSCLFSIMLRSSASKLHRIRHSRISVPQNCARCLTNVSSVDTDMHVIIGRGPTCDVIFLHLLHPQPPSDAPLSVRGEQRPLILMLSYLLAVLTIRVRS